MSGFKSKILGSAIRLVAVDPRLPSVRHHSVHPDMHHARRVRAVVRGLPTCAPLRSLHLHHVL